MDSRSKKALIAAAICLGSGQIGCDVASRAAEAESPRARPKMAALKLSAQTRARTVTRAFRAPPVKAEQLCAESTFSGLDDVHLGLVRRVEDTRETGKNLLALEMRELLESREFGAVRRESLHLSNETAASAALEGAPGRLTERPFFAVYHVVDYREPRLFYNLKKNKRQWRGGALETTLAIYRVDQTVGVAESEAPLCQTRVRVENDVRLRPTTRRQQSETHAALLLELGELMRQASPGALRRISRHLRFVD